MRIILFLLFVTSIFYVASHWNPVDSILYPDIEPDIDADRQSCADMGMSYDSSHKELVICYVTDPVMVEVIKRQQ